MQGRLNMQPWWTKSRKNAWECVQDHFWERALLVRYNFYRLNARIITVAQSYIHYRQENSDGKN